MNSKVSRFGSLPSLGSLPRWAIAVLIAFSLHSAAVIAWIGFESQLGAEFGNQGVEVGLKIVGDLKDATHELQPEKPVEEPPLEPEPIPQFTEPVVMPEIDRKLPDPDLLTVDQPLTEFKLPELQLAMPNLDISPQALQEASAQSATIGTGSSDQVGSSKRLSRSYLARVAAHLNRHKKYPKTSRRAGEEGRVDVALTVFSDGSVDSVRIVKSSGFSELDAEALRMVERATPFPKFSNAMLNRGIDELKFRSSINFSLKQQ